jgi:Starch-binding associating with outer membrane
MKKILLISGLLFTLASCTKDLSKLNIDPKNPVNIPSATLFSNAQLNLANDLATPNVNVNIWEMISQYWTETTYTDESNYDLSTRPIPQTWWHTLYRDVLKNFEEAKTLLVTDVTDAAVQKNQLAIAEIMEVFSYHYIVTTFGDIPYSEALDFNKVQPVYDDAKTVYDALIARLDAAIGNLNTSADSFGDADLLYGGDVAAWKKFANSIKLKMGILIADSDPAKSKTMIESAAAGAFTSNSDNAAFQFLSAPPNTNPVWVNLVQSGRKDFVAANTLVNAMKALNDPRIPLYFTVDGGGVAYTGGIYGASNNFATYSKPSDDLQAPEFPYTFMSYSEVEFILAEAAARGMTVGGTAESHYNNAISASILQWGGTNASAIVYLAQPSVAYTTAAGTYKQKIGTQKWISLYGQGHDAWTDWRRLDYPQLVKPVDALSAIPVRYFYPVSEQNLNGANVASAVAKLGGQDVVSVKLWFDKF